ncbi:MAG: helix-turn-helix domain-containing protein [Deltaproteobacteria bacterium]|nr:helix-turn-helix domain-containing protein [Deltaproteobacteria bacterium]
MSEASARGARGGGLDGVRVRARRLELRMTQAELARRSGLSQEAISRLESGKIKGLMQSTQEGLAHALGVTVPYLRGEAEEPLPEGHGPAGGGAPPGHGPAGVSAPTLVRDEVDPMNLALDRAFDPRRHELLDALSVREALRDTDRRLQDRVDLLAAARQWLDAAAELRRQHIPVTSENLLLHLGTTPRAAQERANAANAAGDARARELGVEPGSARVQLPTRRRR